MRKLSGTPAEHLTEFQLARQELMESVRDAQEAMANGQCRAAGAHIDRGYVAYGRMQANAYSGEDISEAARLLQELRNADEPFEKKCVRDEPLSETYERTMRALRPGLAGASDEVAKLEQARRWLRQEFNSRYDGYSHPSHLVDKLMKEAETRFGLASNGVGGWARDVGGRRGVQYLNYGDPYTPTIVALSTPTSVRFVLASGGWAPHSHNENSTRAVRPGLEGVASVNVPQLVVTPSDVTLYRKDWDGDNYEAGQVPVEAAVFTAVGRGLILLTIVSADVRYHTMFRDVESSRDVLGNSLFESNFGFVEAFYATLGLSNRAQEALDVWLDRVKELGLV